jgi:hypothetical protein
VAAARTLTPGLGSLPGHGPIRRCLPARVEAYHSLAEDAEAVLVDAALVEFREWTKGWTRG